MIVVVEGPSAAGKTTWIDRYCDPAIAVPETTVAEAAGAPDSLQDPRGAAEFWTAINSARWERAHRLEARLGVAVCDTDPFKLHYEWSLWRIGHLGDAQWAAALDSKRRAFAAGRLGLADLVLIAVPEQATLVERRAGDWTRTRHNFERHLQLAAPLAEWYEAVQRLDPGRVIWELPTHGMPFEVLPRQPRTGAKLFEDLMSGLPTV